MGSSSPLDSWKARNVQSSRINLVHSILSPASLRKMNEWFDTLGLDIVEDRGIAATSSTSDRVKWTNRLQKWLKGNEEDLDVHWTETEVAISEVILSSTGPHSMPDLPPDPAAWICAVILFLIANDYGFGPSTTRIFVYALSKDSNRGLGTLDLFEKASPVPETEAVRNFRDDLNRSGHTCWSSQPHFGDHNLADMYSSAYSMLMNTSEVPVVGCGQSHNLRLDFDEGFGDGPLIDSECDICHTKDMLNDLSCSFDDTTAMWTKFSPTVMAGAEGPDRLLCEMVNRQKPVLTYPGVGANRCLNFQEDHRNRTGRQLLSFHDSKKFSKFLINIGVRSLLSTTS
jgi:hypothetical protein